VGILGWCTGGASGFGPSSVYDLLPYKGWKETSTWLEEAVDAIGLELDYRNIKFLKAQARANLLDQTYTPGSAVVRDTMLDVLLYLALGYYPADTNLTVAQKQALTQIGWTALRRKGTRLQLLNLAAQLSEGIVYGWTVPPFNFSIILPDGAPAPGNGNWVPATSSLAETYRPWLLSAIRQVLSRGMFPDWGQLGVGYSQFRAGYSSAGETVFPAGARINILAHEHFDAWGAGVPTGWTKTGSATLTQSTSAPSINWEFTGNAAILDLTSAGAGISCGLSQATTAVNNQLTHRCQLDYSYTNSQNVATLAMQISDANRDGNTYYWNPTLGTWSTTMLNIVVPPSAARARFAIDVVPQASSATATAQGTTALTVAVSATSDGTATYQQQYTIYRIGLYDKFNLAVETAALGERTLWLPMIDAAGWASGTRSLSGTIVEPANALRTAYKTSATNEVIFPYHPALTGRGALHTSTWTNLVKGSNAFTTDWTTPNATPTANSQISPNIGEVSPTAPLLAANATGPILQQTFPITPTSKSYVGGIWVKKVSTDGNFTDVKITLAATTIFTKTFTLKQGDGWQLLPFQFSFGGSEVNTMVFKVSWGAASSTGQITVASAYLYDVTGKTGVFYPPVVQTPVGATANVNPSSFAARAAGANVLHPLTQRTMVSVVRNSLGLTIVPTFDATSQPDGVIFDVAQGATQNRVVLRVASGVLELRRWDNAGNQWVASLTLTVKPTPVAGSMSWLRDTALTVRCVWDENSTMIGAGNGTAFGTKPGSWTPLDASVAKATIGADFNLANPFDGFTRGLELVQLGAAAS
jgi:hypothetical protein